MLDDRHRVRIRFRKEGDLRLTGHHDLLRMFERLFRRAQLPLRMSEGFHPKPKISFPSALSLGIRGADELMEVEFAESLSADELTERLAVQCPEGLVITQVTVLPPESKKPQLKLLTYEFPVPEDRSAATQQAIEKLRAATSHLIHREGRDEPIELCESLADIELDREIVRFSLKATRTAGVRPREVLAELGLAELEHEGYYLTRTAVEVTPLTEQSELT